MKLFTINRTNEMVKMLIMEQCKGNASTFYNIFQLISAKNIANRLDMYIIVSTGCCFAYGVDEVNKGLD